MITANHHVLAVPHARASADFFTRQLGFREVFAEGGWIFVQRDNCMIMLGECPDDIHPSKLGCHNYFAYLHVDNADAYFKEWKAAGVEFISDIADKPWHMREFGIRSPDGYRILIGHRIG